MTFYLGIDVGSGSSRAAIISSTSGKILGLSTTAFSTSRPAPDYYEQSSTEIWQSIRTSVAGALAKANAVDSNVTKETILGVGFDATCSLVAYTDGGPENAKPVSISPSSGFENHERDIIMWCDHRAKEQAQRITDTQHPILKNIGGKMSLEMELPKTLWLHDNMPKEKWDRIGRFFDLPDFLTWKATGQYFPSRCSVVCKWCYKAGPSSSTSSTLQQPQQEGWPTDFLHDIGLGEFAQDGFRKLCGPKNPAQKVNFAGEFIGGLTESAAADLGLLPGTAVGGAVIDAYAGVIGTLGAKIQGIEPSLSEASKRIAMICGTSSCHLMMSPDEIFVPGVWGPFNGVLLDDLWVAEGGQSSTGQLIDHVAKSHIAYDEAVKLAASCEPPLNVYAYLNQRLNELTPNNKNLAYLTKGLHMTPDHHGNRSPFANDGMRGSIVGLDLNSANVDGLAVLYLATVQALALGTRQILDALTMAGYTIETACISGGLAMNDLFVRVMADVTQRPVVMPGVGADGAVVMGAAICGAVAYQTSPQGGSGPISGALWKTMTELTEAAATIEPDTDEALKRFYEAKYKVVCAMQKDAASYAQLMRDC